MNFPHPLLRTFPLLLALSAAQAAPSADARLDVTATCPGIADVMQDVMAPALHHERLSSTIRVQFRVKDGSTAEIRQFSYAPHIYRHAVRLAMSRVNCARREDGQLFTFLLRLTPEGEQAGNGGDSRYSVALLER